MYEMQNLKAYRDDPLMTNGSIVRFLLNGDSRISCAVLHADTEY
jgi:hypothetical protein